MALNFSDKGITNSVSRLTFNGPNLQPIKDWSERTINGVTCSVSDGVGYLNGTSTAGSWQRIETGSITLSAGTYTIYFFTNFIQLDDGKNRLAYIGIGLRNSAHEDLFHFNGAGYKTFTLSGTETFDIVFWWNTSGMIFSNTYVKSMVRQGGYNPSYKFNPYGPDNEVTTLVKDGEVVWEKPFTFSTSFSGVQSDDWSARVVSTQEPTSSPRNITSGNRIYFDDSMSFTCLDGVRTTRVTTYWEYNGELSISSTDVSSLFTGNYGFIYTNHNNTTVTVYWYAEYYPDPSQPYGPKTRNPSSGWSKAGDVAPNVEWGVTGCIPATSAWRSICIKVSKVDYQRQDTDTNTYSGGDVSGLTNKNTSTVVVESGLSQKTITGIVGDNVVLSLTRVDNTTSQRTGTTRTIESNTYVFNTYGPDNEEMTLVKEVKDGEVVWEKPFTFSTSFSGVQSDDWSARVVSTQEPTSSPRNITSGNRIYFDDSMSFTCLDGVRTTRVTTYWEYNGELSISSTDVSSLFTGNYGFIYTNHNNTTVTVYWYADYYPDPSQPYGPKTRNPSSGWSKAGDVAPNVAWSVTGCIPATSAWRSICIKVSKVDYQRQDTDTNTYSGGDVSGLTNKNTSTVVVESGLSQKTITGIVGDNVVLSLTRVDNTTSQRTGTTRTIESNTYVFNTYGPDNEEMTLVKEVKDGEVVWEKPFTFSTSFSGVQSDDWSARVVSTQEPTSSPRNITSGNRIYFDDSMSFTCLDGVRTTRVTTYWEYNGELSISSTDVSSLFTGNYGFIYTNHNNTTVTVYWYADYYPDPSQPYGPKTRNPSSGWSKAGDVAPNVAWSVTGCIPATSAWRSICIKVSKVDYQRQDTDTNTYSGGDVSGLTNKNTSTVVVESGLSQKTITGIVGDNVVLSLTRVDNTTSQRTGTTRTIESNTYVFNTYGPDNEEMTLVKEVKDGEVVWEKPFTFSTSFSGVQSDDWSARVVSTQEPTSSPRNITSGNRIYFDDSMSFTCLDGVRTTRVTTYWEYNGELSISSTDVSSLFTGNYGFIYTNHNNTTVTVYWYADYYPDPSQPYGPKTRNPSSGWSKAGDVAPNVAWSVTGCIPATSAWRSICIKVSKVDYQRQDTDTNTYSGGDVSGLTNKNTSTVVVESGLSQKTITGIVGDNVVLSLTRVDNTTSQRTGTTRTIESNTYVFNTYGPDNEEMTLVKEVKDGEVVWEKPFTFSTSFSGVQSDDWSARVVSTQEPTSSPRNITSGNRIYFDDSMSFTCLDGVRTTRVTTYWEYNGELSISSTDVSSLFTGNYGFIYTNHNNTTVTVYWYADYYPDPSQPYGPKTRNPSSGWSKAGDVAPNVEWGVTGCIPATSAWRSICIKVSKVDYQRQDTDTNTYSGGDVSGLTNKNTSTVVVESGLSQKTITGIVGDNVVLSLTRVDNTTSQRTGTTRTIESNTYVFNT